MTGEWIFEENYKFIGILQCTNTIMVGNNDMISPDYLIGRTSNYGYDNIDSITYNIIFYHYDITIL